MEFTLGRQPDNDIVIDEPVVGRKHLKIGYVSDNELLIEDLGTTNLTFVNGNRISKKLISPKDQVALGSYKLDTAMIFTTVLKKIKDSKMDFTQEFNDLKKIYSDYERKVNRLNKNSQITPLLLKAGFTAVTMILVFFLLDDQNLRYPVMMAAGIIGGFVTLLPTKSETNMKDKKDSLDVEVMKLYKCPKCGVSLFSHRWKYWADQKKCDKCQAIWNK